MKAIRVHETGGPEKLVADTLDTPTPGAGEVLVRVRAAGVNYIDTYHRTGLYPAPVPVRRGLEGAAMLQGMTAHYLARNAHRLRPGDTCLVHAAGGAGVRWSTTR